MPTVTDITGVGPAKAETLEENGYEDLEEIANADDEQLADIDGVSDDMAIEFIVEADDLLGEEVEEDDGDETEEFDLTPEEVSDELEDMEEEVEVEEEDLAESEEDEDEYESPYTVTISFSDEDEYHTFHAAIMRYHEDVYESYQPRANAMRKVLDGIDDTSVTYELTEEEFNALHTAVKQQRINYQSDNLVDHMEHIQAVEEQVNEQRREKLF